VSAVVNSKKYDLSIITPCFNEEGNVEICATAVREVMASKLPGIKYEHIFIDNASLDGTVEVLRNLASQDPQIKVLVNSRNVGPFRNMYRGMARTSGNAVIPMLPADLQDPATLIPDLYQELQKGFLVVYGVRSNRKESLAMRVVRSLYYRLIRLMSETDIPVNAGEFMIIDHRIAEEILKLNDHYPYIRGLVAQSTSQSSYVNYTWEKRIHGKSKSNWFTLLDQGINGLISTSRAPARLALLLGFIIASFGVLGGIANLLIGAIYGFNAGSGIPTLIIGLFFFGGIQLFFTGLLGEYILSIHSQTRQLPNAFSVEELNFD
jgi:glycosyltransferase involved in cell wall biosynthesis